MNKALRRWLLFAGGFAALCVILYLLFAQLGWSSPCRASNLMSCRNVKLHPPAGL